MRGDATFLYMALSLLEDQVFLSVSHCRVTSIERRVVQTAKKWLWKMSWLSSIDVYSVRTKEEYEDDEVMWSRGMNESEGHYGQL